MSDGKPKKIRAFISYASKDKKYFEQLVEGLKGHSLGSEVMDWNFWDDRQILMGSEWHDSIQQAIEQSDFAILLVSRNFVSSGYIKENELKRFLEEQKKRGFLVFPVLLLPYRIDRIAAISQLQFFKPLYREFFYSGPRAEKTELMPFSAVAKDDGLAEEYYIRLVESVERAIKEQQEKKAAEELARQKEEAEKQKQRQAEAEKKQRALEENQRREADKKLFEEAKLENTTAAYKRYQNQTQEGLFLKEVQAAIDRLEQKAAAERERAAQEKKQQAEQEDQHLFGIARAENTVAAYEYYLRNSKYLLHRKEAETTIARLKKANREAEQEQEATPTPPPTSIKQHGNATSFWQKNRNYLILSPFLIFVLCVGYVFLGPKLNPPIEKPTQPQNGEVVKDLPWLEMVYVEGGSFQMGSEDGEDDEKPVHTVELDGFYIGKYEVTNAEYATFLNAYGSDKVKEGEYAGEKMVSQYEWGVQKVGENWQPAEDHENHPVVYVSWYGANEYAKWLSAQTGQNYRLPTEAEWEFAARGGTESRGYKYAGSNKLDEVGWYGENSGNKTHPVGQKKPNELGLHDMSGNVWEWCFDWHDGYGSGSKTNPKGPSSGSDRVLRGGSWGLSAKYWRVAIRDYGNPSNRRHYIGFRVCRSL